VIYNLALSIVNTSTIVGAVLHLARIEAGNTQSRPSRSLFRSVAQTARVASRFALTATLLSFVAGCGNNYRPVVSAINPVGPAAQPNKFAVVISSPSPTAPGLVTFVDFSGDTVLITANIGVNPYYLVLNSGGTTGYTLNSDSTLTSFSISTQLLASQVLQTTLLNSNNVLPTSILPQGTFTYVTQPNSDPCLLYGTSCSLFTNPLTTFATPPTGRNSIAEFTGSPLNLQQELPVDKSYSPIYVAGAAGAPRSFAISQAVSGGPGLVNTIENTSTPTIDSNNPIKVGVNPVYGVMTGDGKRVFIMNQGDGTVSVINAQTNALDTVPVGATNPIPVGTSPLWADFAPTLNEMVVANAGDGVNPGSASIISIPLCTVTAQISNPNCDPTNPVDANGFGTVVATVPVGVNPRMVGVLQDGSRAYVVNAGNPNLPCGPATASQPANCSVSVISLTTNTVTTTIPLISAPITGSTLVANGHPNYIAVTTGSPTGKVYVTSPEIDTMTVIRTDTDSVETTIPLQGKGVSVRVTAP
jgi:YVTN family beta-propeller protein